MQTSDFPPMRHVKSESKPRRDKKGLTNNKELSSPKKTNIFQEKRQRKAMKERAKRAEVANKEDQLRMVDKAKIVEMVRLWELK